MVMKKRLEYGFDGYRFPAVPRAPRSSRRRHTGNVDDKQICAFELLAAVAGKLLLESESSASSNAAEGKDGPAIQRDVTEELGNFQEGKALKPECLDRGSCVESAILPKGAIQEQKIKHGNGGSSYSENSCVSESTFTEFSGKVYPGVKLESVKNLDAEGNFNSEVEGRPSNLGDLRSVNINNATQKQQLADDGMQTGDITMAGGCSVKDPIKISLTTTNKNTLNNSDCSVQLPLYRDPVPSASFAKHRRNDVKLGIRDDDENSFRCFKRSTKIRAFRHRSHNGYRRIRKLLTSRRWQVAPGLKECEFFNSYKAMRPYGNRKRTYAQQRRHIEKAPKRRKLCSRSFAIAYDQEVSSESVSNLPEKQSNGDNYGSALIAHRGIGTTASVKGLQNPKDPNVKFSIKSFRVPELYIEVPETTTVGSLKKTVMDAVTSILCGSLRVGVVLHGKKVRDDNRTLQQAGISHNGDLDALGFTLEPNLSQVSSSLPQKDPPAAAEKELSGNPASPNLDLALLAIPPHPSPEFKLDKHDDESNHESLEGPTDASRNVVGAESQALVAVERTNVEPLAVVVPMNQKSRRSELSQRRTRRPFSVAEVEALVEAVEQLGTGRWRDVKMRAFDNADHRTYVDLKDKWKTLVHTASIAPQQRRGEPVPQELLDRVLAAHSFWSLQQAKQNGKAHTEAVTIGDAPPQLLEA
ncbi:PREDICTED: telomere repeat-binding protein 2-like [Ipomoea nil]|uniref:telomere repeat-binding protein 2-like n=1 Tax=Ipomoea nil TaxID=35883 RepID=UPI000901AB4D|nr:PREDICTED: telomere repeat-binding protein 2-like [Ipomoea nil]XP_019171936.1 PREDICTED: telomere repeat-binding protein 2-like [Ipomoea nil]